MYICTCYRSRQKDGYIDGWISEQIDVYAYIDIYIRVCGIHGGIYMYLEAYYLFISRSIDLCSCPGV